MFWYHIPVLSGVDENEIVMKNDMSFSEIKSYNGLWMDVHINQG